MKLKGILFKVTAGVFLVVLLSFAALALLPRFINTESVRKAVQSQVSEKLGAHISYGSADFFLFPRPGVAFHNGAVIYRDRVQGSFASLMVRLRLLPLLRGRLGVSSLLLDTPKVSIRLGKKPEEQIHTLEELRGKLRLLFKGLAEDAPNLGIEIEKGNLTLLEGDQAVFSFSDLDADIVFPPRGPTIRITGSSNFSKSMTVLLRMDQESLSGAGAIELRQIGMRPLSRYFMARGPVEVEGSDMGLNLHFRTADMKMIEGNVVASLSSLTLKRRGKTLKIHGDTLKGDFRVGDDLTEVSLQDLK
ncbi:MAG TPA: hypothetical protein VMH06_03875, partial [Thermodesulfovibrionales bacterium]|nr:hypothetical protein [Thermodesulfovibrionales bacterium]